MKAVSTKAEQKTLISYLHEGCYFTVIEQHLSESSQRAHLTCSKTDETVLF